MPNNDGAPGTGYRDERDAALAQADSLRRQNADLVAQNNALRADNEQLRRQLQALGATPVVQGNSSRKYALIAAIVGVLVLLFTAGVVAFLVVRVESPVPESIPQTVPVQEAPPTPTPIPTSQPDPVPNTMRVYPRPT